MAAIAYPSTRTRPMLPAAAPRPVLRVIPGAVGGARPSAAVYRRRRLTAVVVLAVVGAAALLLLRAAAGAIGGAPLTPSAPPASAGVQPVAAVTHLVQPGDTYWSIAASLHVRGDVRAEVDRLVAQRHGAPLRVGDRITVP